MSLSRSTTTCTLSPIKSSSSSLFPTTTAISSAISFESSRTLLQLIGNQILVKLSYVNDVFTDFKTQVYDDDEQEECHFVRIVRIGPGVKNKDSTLPGALVVVHRRGGRYLDDLSQGYGEMYFLMTENDIMTYIDL